MQTFAIIPAAGHSQRMKQPKLLMPWNESTVIQHVIAAWKASRVTHVVAVVRPGDEPLIHLLSSMNIHLVVPPVAPDEMKASVTYGLEYVEQTWRPAANDAWMLAPADMPGLSPAVIDELLNANERDATSILAPSFAGKRGHPVLFPWALAREVQKLAPDEGVNALLDRHSVRLIECSDQAILDDLDTPDDYQRLHSPRNPN